MACQTDTRRDRLAALLGQTQYNGIDFVEIAAADQKTLRVHFLNGVAMKSQVTAATITGGESVPTVAVDKIQDSDWSQDADSRPLLTLTVAAAGDFSFYTLTLASDRLDPYFDQARFSFKANCPSTLDCAPPPPECPPPPADAPPIDYLAKDFLSFRKALSDFSALRYPQWQERAEADFGVMFMEALSALADDLSYTQDRVAAEATLDTATQRRSVVRHARLVDYEPRPAVAASVVLQFDVAAPGDLPAGLLVSAQLPESAPIYFETGTGLVDAKTGKPSQASYPANPLWNRKSAAYAGLLPYWWDTSQSCLKAGATEIWVRGQQLGFYLGQPLLIDSEGAGGTDPPVRELVTLAKFDEQQDPLFALGATPPGPPTPLTHIVLAAPTRLDHDLACTTLAGNLAPATQGRRMAAEPFAIDPPPPGQPPVPPAIARTGPNGATQSLYTLKNAPLAWLPQAGPAAPPLPELFLEQNLPTARDWVWRRVLLDAAPFENAFTLDPVKFAPTARDFQSAAIQDYDSDEGGTIRFGDGRFGGQPAAGDTFQVTYRVGGGAAGNVAADSITQLEPGAPGWIGRVTNPFAAAGGLDEESNQRVRRLAPQAFRAVQFRAVRAEDYVAAAQTLPWVSRAGSVFRWTGSWLTVFTTPDPRGSETIPVAEHVELIDLLNRYRMAGYESYAPAPRYVGLDLYIQVCALPDAFRGDVEAGILKALGSGTFADGQTGFFHPDRFSFGTPLERSRLEAAIQGAVGVAGVSSIRYRRLGVIRLPVDMGDTVPVAPDQIIRVDNDPSRPERGSLHVAVDGGK